MDKKEMNELLAALGKKIGTPDDFEAVIRKFEGGILLDYNGEVLALDIDEATAKALMMAGLQQVVNVAFAFGV